MKTLKVVLDTNVWLDWLVFRDPRVADLVAAIEAGRTVPIASPAQRAELAHVLARMTIEPGRGPVVDPARLLERFDRVVTLAAEAPRCPLVCRDPADQKFLDLAVAERADRLLTRDKALLRLAGRAQRRFGLAIGTPAAGDRDRRRL